MEVINTLGRRKTSVARVYLSKGKGNMVVNDRDYKEFFPISVLQSKLVQPFALTDTVNKYDVKVNVSGGGINGQVEAIRLGISRALVLYNADLRSKLKPKGLLMRDSRMVESKKYGLKKARRGQQFSKR